MSDLKKLSEQDIIKRDGVLLAHKYELKDAKRCEGYACSIKLDGMRSIYDPETDKMYSRAGNEWNIPKYFTKYFPKIVLDGEMFIGVNSFRFTSIVKKKNPTEKEFRESGIKYHVFDGPYLKGTLIERLAQLKELCKDCENIVVVDHWISKNQQQVAEDLDRVEKEGHEGLMLRNPHSKYERKRSKDLLKVKSFFESEAEIIGYESGTGKYTNLLGAYTVRAVESGPSKKDQPPVGTLFSTGSGLTDEDRNNPLPLGTIITVKFWEIDSKSGVPRFPIYKGPRLDATVKVEKKTVKVEKKEEKKEEKE